MKQSDFMSSNSRQKILLADNDIRIYNELVSSMANEGFQIIHCTSINDVLEYEHENISAVVADVLFDKDNGSQLIELVRQLPIGKNMPIIVTAPIESSSEVIVALNAGADDYIFKPFTARELARRIVGIRK